jgi:hypothetical protein
MYYSRVQVRDCIISEISGWNTCQGDEWLIKNEEAVKVGFNKYQFALFSANVPVPKN